MVARLLVNVIALFVVEYIIPGFTFTDYQSLIIAAIVIGVVNTFIRPIFLILTLPLSILTLGIFAFFVNVALLWIVALIVPGFEIDSFLTATVASISLTLVTMFLHKLTKE